MTRTDIPDDLAAAMQAAASAAPPHHGDLAAVRRRGRARRRRRTAAAGVAAAAVAVAAAIAIPSVIAGPVPPPAGPPVAAPPPAVPPGSLPVAPPAARAEPAQRLLLLDSAGMVRIPSGGMVGEEQGETAREAYERLQDVPGAVGVLGGPAELRPDGQVVDLDLALPEIDSVREVVAMPDGRLAAIGIVDRMPGVEREDGPCVEGADFPLLVIEADGSVGLRREVRVRCQALSLVAADAGTAYLVRDSRLVAHDLATGEERVLVDSAEVLGSPDGAYLAGRASIAAGRLVTAAFEAERESCQPDGSAGRIVLRVTDFDTGATSAYPLTTAECAGVPGPVRISPDGRYAAIAFFGSAADLGRADLRVAVLDLDTGDVVADELIVPAPEVSGLPGGTQVGPHQIASTDGAISGIAWDDERTLRVAWYEVPDAGVHWISEVIQVSTVSVA
jgi:hypothetical protein